MKIITFRKPDKPDGFRIGAIVSDAEVVDLTSIVTENGLSETELLKCFDLDGDFFERAKRSTEDLESSNILGLGGVRLFAPVPRPRKVICIGLNYRDHAAESGMAIPESPVIFSKFSTCVIGPNEPVIIPNGSTQTDYEAELAVVIGRHTRNVRRDEAMGSVFGYTNFNDVSARDFQFADGQWQRGKSCDTFAPMGPYIATPDEIPDPQDLSIKFKLNGETLQDSSTKQMIFGVAELVEFLSRHMTLEPGDVIATGTPPGVGFARRPPVYLKEDDVAEVEIEGLGVLMNPVSVK